MRRLRTALGVLLLALPTACGEETGGAGDAAYDPDDDSSTYDSPRSEDVFDSGAGPYEATLTLADGRTVRMWYAEAGDRLMEQHRAADGGRWTPPQVVSEPGDEDPCQGIELVEDEGLVAVIADLGSYCYDGEPPMSSIAAVGAGDLTEWDVHVTRGFDGWTEVEPTGGRFQWSGGGAELTWSVADGFSRPSD
ncbi:hypothetical protein [Nocardioides abyssi]|uniref:Lipoprotein n=1 Tax=Nocardioides abyssi TaxID=3058370 RepID=A0ABT8ETM0_9ACTN|nr:hypothetical protein [Nocardioides abyssi]MDN4161351.1 hypothetical protein [Nocardioides abyssi]